MQKSYKAAKKSRFKQFVNNSIIVSVLTYFSVGLHSLFSKGFMAGVFMSSDTADKSKNSGLLSLVSEKTRADTLFSFIRRNFSLSVENSAIIRLYRIIIKAFMATTVRTIGVFFISAGLYSLLGYSIRLFVLGGVDRTQADAVVILLTVLVSAFLVFSKKSLGRKLGESRIFYFILDLLGINRLAIDTNRTPENHFGIAFFAGLAFGLASFFLTPVKAIYYIFTVITALVVLYSPESGLLISMTAVPFGKEDMLFEVLAVTLVSYILKLLRGKRNLTLKSEDVPALFFALVFMLAFPGISTRRLFIMASAYFMASNLMRNTSLLKKSVYCFSLGLMIKSFIQSSLFVFGMLNLNFTALTGIAAGEYNSYSVFMIIASLPFAAYMLTSKESGFHFIFRLLFVLSVCFNAAVSMSDYIWLSAAVCLFIYLLYRSAKLFNVLFAFGIIVPVIYYIRKAVYVFNHIEPFTPQRPALSKPEFLPLMFGGTDFGGNSLYGLLLKSFGVLGITLGVIFLFMLLSRSFTSSALSRNGEVRSVCAVIIAGISVFLFAGVAENTFVNGNCILMFWILCGLVSATGNAIPRYIFTDDYT